MYHDGGPEDESQVFPELVIANSILDNIPNNVWAPTRIDIKPLNEEIRKQVLGSNSLLLEILLKNSKVAGDTKEVFRCWTWMG